MWEVVATAETKDGREKERRKVVSKWEDVRQLVDRAASRQWKVSVRTVYVDLFLVNPEDGELNILAKRITAGRARYITTYWFKDQVQFGLLYWRHGATPSFRATHLRG